MARDKPGVPIRLTGKEYDKELERLQKQTGAGSSRTDKESKR